MGSVGWEGSWRPGRSVGRGWEQASFFLSHGAWIDTHPPKVEQNPKLGSKILRHFQKRSKLLGQTPDIVGRMIISQKILSKMICSVT